MRPSGDVQAVRRRIVLLALALGAYVVLAVVAYWPVMPLDASKLPHPLGAGAGDPAQMTWFLAWAPFALGHGLNPFFTNYIDFPLGVNLASNTSVPTARSPGGARHVRAGPGRVVQPPDAHRARELSHLDVPRLAKVGEVVARRVRGRAAVRVRVVHDIRELGPPRPRVHGHSSAPALVPRRAVRDPEKLADQGWHPARAVERRSVPHRPGDTGVLRHHGGDRPDLPRAHAQPRGRCPHPRGSARAAHGVRLFRGDRRLSDRVLPHRPPADPSRHSAGRGDRGVPRRSSPTGPALVATAGQLVRLPRRSAAHRPGGTGRVVAEARDHPVRGRVRVRCIRALSRSAPHRRRAHLGRSGSPRRSSSTSRFSSTSSRSGSRASRCSSWRSSWRSASTTPGPGYSSTLAPPGRSPSLSLSIGCGVSCPGPDWTPDCTPLS